MPIISTQHLVCLLFFRGYPRKRSWQPLSWSTCCSPKSCYSWIQSRHAHPSYSKSVLILPSVPSFSVHILTETLNVLSSFLAALIVVLIMKLLIIQVSPFSYCLASLRSRILITLFSHSLNLYPLCGDYLNTLCFLCFLTDKNYKNLSLETFQATICDLVCLRVPSLIIVQKNPLFDCIFHHLNSVL
jgi:hypothetical protein